MKRILFALLLPLAAPGQDLTGLWTGYLQLGDTKLPYELAISGKPGKLTGYSIIVFNFGGVDNEGVKEVELKVKKGSIAVEDGDLLYDNYTIPGRRVKLYGTLAWVGRDQAMTLAGTFATRSLDMRAPGENRFKGMVFLQRKPSTTSSRLLSRLNEMGVTGTLSFLSLQQQPAPLPRHAARSLPGAPNQSDSTTNRVISRNTAVIRRIYFQADSLQLSLYDNGEVDGDTVSVFLDGRVILSRQVLT
ncbi:MAG TPA: hypothetical protein VGC95_12785, partial [Chitinophagaceae bacterium]